MRGLELKSSDVLAKAPTSILCASEGFLALNFRANRSEGRVLQEKSSRSRRKRNRRDTEAGEEEEVKEKVEAMVLGDLMRRGGRRGFPKQLAAISTDPIKINERAACEPKPLRRPVRRSHSLFLFPSLSSVFVSLPRSLSLSFFFFFYTEAATSDRYRRRLLVIVVLRGACWCASLRQHYHRRAENTTFLRKKRKLSVLPM